MVAVKFFNQSEIEDRLLKFAVVAARYNGEWIFCRHKERATWEIPGGHREPAENIIETAKRELHEETGATEFDLKEVCVYGVDRDGDLSYGLLCFAEVEKLGELPPEMEIGQIDFFNHLPQELTYPAIQPFLFEHIQRWLNLQSSSDELWDIYDENRNFTGRTHRRGNPMAKGDYHLVVHVWLQNQNGEYLLTKRTPNKGFPNMWGCTGGSALAGDSSLSAALRELKEETGLIVSPENGRCILSYKRDDNFADIWLFRQNFDIKDVVFQPNETCGAMYAAKDTILQMNKEGLLVPFPYLDDLFAKAEQIDEALIPPPSQLSFR